MAGQADDADVEGEVLAAELGADADLAGELAGPCSSSSRSRKALAGLVALGRQARRGSRAEASLTVLSVSLGRGAADDERRGDRAGRRRCRAGFIFSARNPSGSSG